MSTKVSRYQWPQVKSERIAVIVANLQVPIPDRRWGAKARPTKEDIETETEDTTDETP